MLTSSFSTREQELSSALCLSLFSGLDVSVSFTLQGWFCYGARFTSEASEAQRH